MTRLIARGWESGHIYSESGTQAGTGTLTVTTADARSGSRSVLYDTTGSNLAIGTYWTFSGVADTAYYSSTWYKLNTGYPAGNTRIALFVSAAGTGLASVALLTDGSFQAGINTSTGGTGSPTAAGLAVTGDWFQIKMRFLISAGAADELECYYSYDGTDTLIHSGTGMTISDTAPGRYQIGMTNAPGANETMYADDIIVNDDNGSVHNSYPGLDKVVMLLPTADSAIGNWTGGAGGTTSLFEGVNNTPPVGEATGASSTDTSQVENASSSVPSNLDMTMTTYTAAGIASADTITSVETCIAQGSSSTTGSDTITHELVSNPAVAASGTNSVDIVAGTFPTSWNRGSGAIAENPSVTKGTAPVMRVTKTVNQTRIHTVCFMGINVAYIEAVGGGHLRGPMMVG